MSAPYDTCHEQRGYIPVVKVEKSISTAVERERAQAEVRVCARKVGGDFSVVCGVKKKVMRREAGER